VPDDLSPVATEMSPMLPGDWRSMRPVVDRDKCVKCAVCWLYCPVQCVEEKPAWFDFNLDLQGLRHLRQRMPAARDHHDSGGSMRALCRRVASADFSEEGMMTNPASPFSKWGVLRSNDTGPGQARQTEGHRLEGNEAAALGVALARPTWSPCIRSRRSPRWSNTSPS
jgi:ferredoxin